MGTPIPDIRHGAFVTGLCPAAELGRLAEEVGAWLDPLRPVDMIREYPLLFREDPAIRHLVARDRSGNFLSHVALRTRYLVSGRGRLRYGVVANVATRPEARGRGLAGGLMERALKVLAEGRVAVALLWADPEREGFYGGFGFQRMGRELLFTLKPQEFPGAWPPAVPAGPSQAAGLLALHRREPVRTERTREEMIDLMAIPDTRTLAHLGPRGEPAAYLCLGKGRDFQGVIHETGGELRAVEGLLGAVVSQEPEPRTLILSPLAERLAGRLRQRGCAAAEGALGLGRVLDPEALAVFAAHLGPLADRLRGREGFLPFHLAGLDSM